MQSIFFLAFSHFFLFLCHYYCSQTFVVQARYFEGAATQKDTHSFMDSNKQ